MLYTNFIKCVEKKYGNEYEYEKWDGEKHTHTKIWILCPIHGKVEQYISYLMYNEYKCPECFKEQKSNKKYNNFLIKANKVHNNKYTYEQFFFKNSKQKIKITCPIHGEFEQTISVHLANCGCPSCGKIELTNSLKHTNETVIEKFRQTHGDFYDYSKVEYVGINDNVDIICPIHGIFSQMAQAHISGSGCKECAKIKNSIDTKARFGYGYEKLVEIFNKKHNNKYTYPKFEYENVKQKINIICPTHGVFEQQIASHKNGTGCPECWYCVNVSKKETMWLDSLKETIQRGLRLYLDGEQLRPDGYCASTNTIYLFHGSYWHGEPRVYSREFVNKNNKQTMGELYDDTIIHENLYKEHGYNLVVMWEYDWDMLQKENKNITPHNHIKKSTTKIMFEE